MRENTFGRRRFLQGAALTVTGAAVTGAAIGATRAPADAADAGQQTITKAPQFEGIHQAGITDPAQASAAFVSFDLTARTRGELTELLRTLTERARFLTAGGTPVNNGIAGPPSDSGVLGPVIPTDNLSITVGLGSSVFDGRYGLAARKPKLLRPMDTFANDALDRSQCDGDLLVQVCADHSDTVLHALRDLARNTRGGMQVRWRIDGQSPPPRPTGAPRNLLGFKDGTANPVTTDAAEMNKLVWVPAGAGEPSWAVNGSYHVVRTIRMLVEFWDRVSVSEQERMFGRRKDSGAPLSGTVETDLPNYQNDPLGSTIPLDSHIRVANPRTAATDSQRLLRRGYNYDRGVDSNGNLDMGLVFNAFQADLDRQFVTVQKRLADEPLVDYISPFGGGYFFALPGIVNDSDWYGRGLLS
ncbi:MAG: efeB 2 [Frankiales bacterium]|nr:efeB 2 [Frankiales bacterium]